MDHSVYNKVLSFFKTDRHKFFKSSHKIRLKTDFKHKFTILINSYNPNKYNQVDLQDNCVN